MTTLRWLAFILALLILVPAALFGAPSTPNDRASGERISRQRSWTELAAQARYEALARSAPHAEARAILGALAGR